MNKLKEEVIRNKFRRKFRHLSKRTLENMIPQLRNEIYVLNSKIHSVGEMDSSKLKEKRSIKGIEIIEVERALIRIESQTKIKEL